MYYVNKIVAWVLSPMGLLFLGLAAAAVAARCRAPRFLSRGLVVLTLAFAWLMGCGVTLRLIGLPLEMDECEPSALPTAEAIVVLGGGVGLHERCGRAELFAAADRVWMGAKLHRLGKAPKVIVTGQGCERATRELLLDFGVPAEAIVTLPEARNTEEESKLLRKACGAAAHPAILLVSSAWHLPRAKTLFERRGFRVLPAPTDFEMHYAAELPLQVGDFFPNAEAMARNGYALKEWVARFGYAVTGR